MVNIAQRVVKMIDSAGAKIGIAVGGTVLGLTWSEWAAIVTIVYVAMQIVVLLPKFYETVKRWVLKHGSPPPG
jgi:hypothetical protein